VAKITFTFPEDDDPISSSAFVIVSPQPPKRSSRAFQLDLVAATTLGG